MSLFCCALLCVHLEEEEKLVVLLLLSYRYNVTINGRWLFLTVRGLVFSMWYLVFPNDTRLLFHPAGKVMASIFWDSQGVIMIDYLEQCRTINGANCKKEVRRTHLLCSALARTTPLPIRHKLP